ncbi:RNA 2',3'-cyclic phosphodiesterase [Jeongeupia naejangsanensis]|uniref:RNA 2',3'-cyclic phosphodiesterase n=1 Tax=Jeongeupia naejangsanensis TaxID=613195 RepID=A0ABS2BG96_9NEIS|nr:RNA 2',3'-cyclic phosphodiesterase [Jeongeupia naejangsanensis]MBM3114624.1 RNA 2',3'-cyclic phosphodiesterase [Jeongeupia naejangsanensis]
MRLFIGLTPPSAVRNAIADERDRLHVSLGGKPTTTANLHLTLVFIGEATVQTMQRLCHLLSRIDMPRFDIGLDRAGDFKRGAIVWLGCSAVPGELATLAETLRQALTDAGIPFDALAFAPHVTLLRKGQPVAETLASTIHWPVDSLVLYASESTPDGVRYRPLFHRPLK